MVRWLEYSKRNTCELCNHHFSFSPIYAAGTPRFLPMNVFLTGLLNNFRRFIFKWFHFIIVFFMWLVVVPLTACRIYRCLFTGTLSSLLSLPLDILSTHHIMQDCVMVYNFYHVNFRVLRLHFWHWLRFWATFF